MHLKKVRNSEVYKLLVEEEISSGSYINIYISVCVYIYINPNYVHYI